MRGIGAIEVLQGVLPGWAVPAVVALTQLGDVWFVVALATLAYWFVDRRDGAFALAAILGALALTVGLKALFALPRPPSSVHLAAADGYGFPSGHAIAATAGWGGLAAVLGVGSRRRRVALAAAVVGLVSLSRVALGVHYLADVVAGVAVGGAYLAGALWLAGRDPERAAAGAFLLALGALAAALLGADAAALLGADAAALLGADAAGILGAGAAALAVLRFGDVPSRPWGRDGVLPAAGSLALVGTVAWLVYEPAMGLPLAFGLGAFAVGVVLAAPRLTPPRRPRGRTGGSRRRR